MLCTQVMYTKRYTLRMHVAAGTNTVTKQVKTPRSCSRKDMSSSVASLFRSVTSGQNGWFAPLTKLRAAIAQRGIKGTLLQLYTIGDLKFGTLKGMDKHGNRYYENVELPYGQHRWVEYANIHNPDPTMIHPEWHGWMHHVFDHTPTEQAHGVSTNDGLEISAISHARQLYTTNVGRTKVADQEAQYNTSQYRHRGYKVGSLMIGPDDKDNYYLQPGHPMHPLSEKGGRFEPAQTGEEWVPPADSKLYSGETGRKKK